MSGIKEHVSGTVKFVKYLGGNLYYRTESGLEFAVPISDTGNATFPAEEKGMMFMRWIRKHLELIQNPVTQDESIAEQPTT
jgi:hypothetical protein